MVKKQGESSVPKGFENADKLNYYDDFSTVHIDTIYKNGKFYNIKDESAIEMENGSLVKLIVCRKDIPKTKQKAFESEIRTVMQSGDILTFKVQGTHKYFDCILKEDLVFEKEGNKLSKAKNIKCLVQPASKMPTEEIDPFVVDSLNQAYFQMSLKLKPNALSHSINIYTLFYSDEGLLEKYRF